MIVYIFSILLGLFSGLSVRGQGVQGLKNLYTIDLYVFVIISLAFLINNYYINQRTKKGFIFRYKSYLHLFFHTTILSCLGIIGIILIIRVFECLITFYFDFSLIIYEMNSFIFLLFLCSIVNVIAAKNKDYTRISTLVFACLLPINYFMDVLTYRLNFEGFRLQYLFYLPEWFNQYYYIWGIVIVIIIVLRLVECYICIKNDVLLGENHVEK